MRALGECSGPWVGWSVQYNRKIHERLVFEIGGGKLSGSGEDADGDFELAGDYEMDGEVVLIRTYTFCSIGPEGVGIPYLYRGRWDGMVISGLWKPVAGFYDGGPFEMWPEDPLAEIVFGRIAEPESMAT